MGKYELDALRAEDVRRFYALDKDPDMPNQPSKRARRYFSRLRVLDFIRTVFDALLLAIQEVRKHCPDYRPNADEIRWVNRWKEKLLLEPVKQAYEVKRWAGVARALYFDDPSMKRSMLPLVFRRMTKTQLLRVSYMGRALPPPPRERQALLADYVLRMRSEPPPEDPGWRPFIRAYLREFSPPKPVDYRTDPSVSASFGLPRVYGGFTAAVQSLVSLGFSLWYEAFARFDGPYEEAVVRVRSHLSSLGWELPDTYLRAIAESDSSSFSLAGHFAAVMRESPATFSNIMPAGPLNRKVLSDTTTGAEFRSRLRAGPSMTIEGFFSTNAHNESRYSFYLGIAVHAILRAVTHIPLAPIYAEEKGLKVRYPATTIAAATLVYQLFRRAIDSHLTQDKRHAASLSGAFEYPLATLRRRDNRNPKLGKRVYYSQDLSFATDLHPHWLTRTVYEELLDTGKHPALEEFRPYFGKLFGPHILFTQEHDMPDYPWELLQLTKLASDVPDDYDAKWAALVVQGDVSVSRIPLAVQFERRIPVPAQRIREQLHRWRKFVIDINDHVDRHPGLLTTTSASMGDATSFPVMPLITSYGAEKIKEHRFQAIPARRRAKVSAKIAENPNYLRPPFISCGDDADFADLLLSEISLYEDFLPTVGCVPSRGDPEKGKPNKMFTHPIKSIFCEMPYLGTNTGLRVVPVSHLSLWSMPPGGSKGAVSWFNQPSSVRQHYESYGIPVERGLWKYTASFWPTKAAFALGLPVGAPVDLGGLHHPLFKQMAGLRKRRNQQWLRAVSQLTKVQLALGTGLNPLPSGLSQYSAKLAKAEVEKLATTQIKQGSDVPVMNAKQRFAYMRIHGVPPPPPLPPKPVEVSTRFRDDGRENISLSEFVDLQMRVVTSWEAFTRSPPAELTAPRIRFCVHKFARATRRYRRVAKLENKPLDRDATLADVSVKKSSAYIDADYAPAMLSSSTNRAYGLRPSRAAKGERATAAWQSLSQFRTDLAYLNPKQDAMPGVK